MYNNQIKTTSVFSKTFTNTGMIRSLTNQTMQFPEILSLYSCITTFGYHVRYILN